MLQDCLGLQVLCEHVGWIVIRPDLVDLQRLPLHFILNPQILYFDVPGLSESLPVRNAHRRICISSDKSLH